MSERFSSFGRPTSNWDCYDTMFVLTAALVVGGGFLMLDRMNDTRTRANTILQHEQNPRLSDEGVAKVHSQR